MDGAPIELAQAASAESIGRVDTIKGNVFITRTDGTKLQAESGQDIFQGDVVETDGQGAVGIVFADDSTFSLAEAGKMTIDEMVYDPGGQEGQAALSVAQGVFTFVSGQIAKTAVNAMVINTPTATLGIRGTSGGGKSSSTKGDTFSLFQDADGNTGEMTISTQVGATTLNTPNQTTRIISKFALPSKPIVMPESAVNQFYGAAIAAAPPAPTARDQNQQGDTQGEQGQVEGEGGQQTQEGEAEQAAEGEAGAQAEQQIEGEAQLEGGEPLPEGEQLSAEEAVQQALSSGDAGDDAALAAAVAEARANGISEAEIQAGAGAFQDALAEGGSLDDAFDAAMSAGEAAGVQAAIQFDQAIQQAQQQGAFGANGGIGPVGGPVGDPAPVTDTGGQDGQDGGGSQQGDDPFGGGLFGGDILGGDIFGNDIFGDPLGNTLLSDTSLIDALFDPPPAPLDLDTLDDVIDDIEEDDNISSVDDDDVIFGEEFINTSGDDTFAGNAENTEYRYDQASDGGIPVSVSGGGTFGTTLYDSDIIVDNGGASDRLTFESLDSIGIKMSVGSAGFIDFHIYSEFTDTSSLSTVLTYIQVEDTVEDIQGSVDTLSNLDSGIVIENAMEVSGSETAYILVGGSSADTITVSDSNSVGALLFGKDGNDTLTGHSGSDEVLYGGAGNDELDAKGSANGDSIYGGAGNDIVYVTNSAGNSSFDGGDDNDTLDYSGLGSQVSFAIGTEKIYADHGSSNGVGAENFEYLIGTTAADTFVFSGDTSIIDLHSVAGGTGNDVFRISENATVTATLDGGAGNDIFEIGENSSISTTLDGGAGTDSIGLDSTSSTITFVNFENAFLLGTESGETLTLDATTVGGLTINSVDANGGDDTLSISAGIDVSNLVIYDTEIINDADGTDSIILGSGGQTTTINGIEIVTGGSGADSVTLGTSGTTTYFSGVESITGSTGNDYFFLLSAGTYTLTGNGGTDQINWNFSGNVSLHLTGIDTIVGTQPGPYNTTLLNSQNGLFVRGSGSSDSLSLAGGGNTISVYGDVDSVTGGTGADHLTVTSTVTNATYDLGGGSDSLSLASGNNTLTASNIETITGGANDDTITLGASQGSGTIDGGAGTDQVTLANGTNSLTLANMETVVGGTGTDIVTLGSGVNNTIAATNM